MAKKKKKFKKKISQNLSERIAQIETEKPKVVDTASPESKSLKAVPAGRQVQKSSAQPPQDGATDADKYAYVRRDVKRDFVIIAILVILLVAATIVNAKTTYLKQASDWIYQTLNLKV